jgi:hypothetical protein
LNKNDNKYAKMKNQTETDSPNINRLPAKEDTKIKIENNEDKENKEKVKSTITKSHNKDHMIKDTNENISMNDLDEDSMDKDETI